MNEVLMPIDSQRARIGSIAHNNFKAPPPNAGAGFSYGHAPAAVRALNFGHTLPASQQPYRRTFVTGRFTIDCRRQGMVTIW